MENVSSSSNHTITASSFVLCPHLPEFLQWSKEYLTPVVFYNSVAAITINGLLLPVTAISNVLIMISILVDKKLRRNPFMIMLLSLSATDFLIGFLVQPIFIVFQVSMLTGRLDLFCKARQLQTVIGVVCISASLGHTCLISVERYLAVRFPNRYKNILTNGRVVMIVLLIWLFVTTYAVLLYAGLLKGGVLISPMVIVFILIAVTAAFYVGTFRGTVTEFPRLSINRATSGVSPDVPSHSRSQGSKYRPCQFKTSGGTSGSSSDDFPIADRPSKTGVRFDQTSRMSVKVINSKIVDQSLSYDGKFLQSSTSGVSMNQTSRLEKKSEMVTNSPIADQSLYHDGKFLQPSTSGVSMNQTSRIENKSEKVTNSSIADQSLYHDGKFLQPSTSGLSMNQISRIEDKPDNFTNKAQTFGHLSAAALRRKMREKKLAKTMFITVGFLAFCYFPKLIAHLLLPKSKEKMAVYWAVTSWTTNLLCFNSFVNPFRYSLRMPDIRKTVLKFVMRR